MNLLIVNALPQGDEAAKKAVETLRQKADQCWVIHAFEKNLRPCVGCNACWLRTPGICSIKDGYEDLLKEYLAADAVVFLSGTALNFVDYRMKNMIDRVLPLATMHIQIVKGECRHVPRYQKDLRFGLLYSGEADRTYLNRWMDRVMLNLSGENIGVYPIEKAEEVSL